MSVEKVETATEKTDRVKTATEEEKEKEEHQEKKNCKFAKEQEETVLNSGIYRLKRQVAVSASGNPLYRVGICEGGSKLVIDGKDNFMRVWNTTTMIQTFQTSDGETHAENMWTKSLLSSILNPGGTQLAVDRGRDRGHE